MCFFFRFCCGDAFCTDTLLQTDDVTHRSLYTEQLLFADTLAQRGLCTEKLSHTQMPLHTEAFTQRSFYTEIFTYRCSAQRCFCTHKGTQALLHAELFTQRSLCLYTKRLLRRKTLTQRNLYTQTAQRSFYTPKLLHAETLPREAFTHTQKLFRTDAFTHRSFYAQQFLHTDAFTHRCFYTENLLHTETCAHSTLLHTASFYTERLCFPCLITYSTFRVPPFSGLYQVTWVYMKMGYLRIQWSIITFPCETHMSYVFIYIYNIIYVYIYIYIHIYLVTVISDCLPMLVGLTCPFPVVNPP